MSSSSRRRRGRRNLQLIGQQQQPSRAPQSHHLKPLQPPPRRFPARAVDVAVALATSHIAAVAEGRQHESRSLGFGDG
uniref:Uncharacterized protein n=1 Tax=Oryza sativa subsp. japonica TaxID=39947 RepID=Q69TQ3_ORYSJ|nr:hypothetical protein [Oryza sativa Japonica Group]BAD35774.1 hypothetical protein [Oryza sativa Japonica Group]